MQGRFFGTEHAKNRATRGFRPARLATLIWLRWLAIAGQTVGIVAVHYGAGFELPLVPCFGVITISVLVNFTLIFRFGGGQRVSSGFAALQLSFDLIQLGSLLWLTGGLENPFSLLLLAPVSVCATMLPRVATLAVTSLAGAFVVLLSVSHMPLPWDPALPLVFDPLYIRGLLASLLCGVIFIAGYTNRVAHEARQLADALAATELALSARQQLSALDGLAAAAAHELGTPLSTIALVANERRQDPQAAGTAEDLDLIVEQVDRCRAILGKLRNLGAEEGHPFAALTMREMIEEIVAPLRSRAKKISILSLSDPAHEPVLPRNEGLLYGLGNLVENAVRFAKSRVEINAEWDDKGFSFCVWDDGPGFAAELIAELGEPYLTHRLSLQGQEESSDGLGLGIFIAKTLLARTGGQISFSNRSAYGHAEVRVYWPVEEYQF